MIKLTKEQFKIILIPIIKFNTKSASLEKDYGINIHENYVDLLYQTIDALFLLVFKESEIDYINEYIYNNAFINIDITSIDLDMLYDKLTSKID